MKTIRWLLIVASLLLRTHVAMAASNSSLREEYVPVLSRRPVVVDQLLGPGWALKGAIHNLSFWQAEHLDRKFQKAEPVIENGILIGWKVWSTKTSGFEPTFFGYISMEASFILPPNMTTDSLLKEIWKTVSRGMHQEKPSPIAVNSVVRVDGSTEIIGVWYSYKNSDAKIAKGNLQNPTIVGRLEEYAKISRDRMEFVLPLPKEVLNHPDRYIARRPVPVPMVHIGGGMTIVEGSTMGIWQFRYDRGNPRKTEYMRIVDLSLESPIYKAGISGGMFIWSVNGITTVGLPNSDGFRDRIIASTTSEGLRFEVSDTAYGRHRIIVVPFDTQN